MPPWPPRGRPGVPLVPPNRKGKRPLGFGDGPVFNALEAVAERITGREDVVAGLGGDGPGSRRRSGDQTMPSRDPETGQFLPEDGGSGDPWSDFFADVDYSDMYIQEIHAETNGQTSATTDILNVEVGGGRLDADEVALILGFERMVSLFMKAGAAAGTQAGPFEVELMINGSDSERTGFDDNWDETGTESAFTNAGTRLQQQNLDYVVLSTRENGNDSMTEEKAHWFPYVGRTPPVLDETDNLTLAATWNSDDNSYQGEAWYRLAVLPVQIPGQRPTFGI